MADHQTTLKLQADQTFDQLIATHPMRISDAANMLRRPVGKNERPYDKAVLTGNNKLVDRWYSEVLMKLCDRDGTVPAGRVTDCFNYFLQGIEITQHQKYKRYLPTYTEEMVRFWIDTFLNRSMEEIHEMGPGVVAAGWAVITNAVKFHFAERRWNEIYSTTTDPREWDRLANNNPGVMHGRPLPYGLSTETLLAIEEKVRSMLTHLIEPK